MAVITLAIGLTAVTTTFSVVRTVLLRELPFADADRIVTVSQTIPFLGAGPRVSTIEEFQRWQNSGLFESVAAFDGAEYTLEANGRPERIYGASVTPDFFRVFNVHPLLGRGLVSDDAAAGHDNVVVLSHQLWARRFASDPGVVGKKTLLSGAPATVIGVMPPRFDFPRLADVSTIMTWAPEQAEFWTPLQVTPKMLDEGNFNYYVLGRLRPGVTAQRATQELKAIAVRIFRAGEVKQPAYRDILEQLIRVFSVDVTPLRDSMSARVREVLWMLFGAVAFLFILVLFNLSNLLLTQNTHRVREYMVHRALGASRWQLFRQSFLEQVALVGAATVLGVLLTSWCVDGIRAIGANRLPRLYGLSFSLQDVLLLAILSLLVAVVFGSLSQLLLSGSELEAILRSEGRSSTGDRRTSRMKTGLMIAQIAISMVLVVGAGLLVQSFVNVLHVNPGFDTRNLLTFKVSYSAGENETPAKRLQHTRELLEHLRRLPGVESVSVVNRLPLTGDTEIHNAHAVGKPYDKAPEAVSAEYRVIDPEYFHTMRIPLLAGRFFRPDDPPGSVIINHKMASRFWPGEDAVGKQLTDGDHPPFTVLGVIGDVHNGSLERETMMQYYRPLAADPYYSDTFLLRTAVNPASHIEAVQKAVSRLDPSEPVTHPQTMEHVFQAVTLERRLETALLTGFAAIALFLSALGIFGIASLSVARRSREFGIRFALGATGAHVVRLEFRRTLAILVFGLAAGMIACLALSRLLTTLLYGVTPWNGTTYLLAVLTLAVSALLAAWIPARRAANIDPAATLRLE